MAHLDLSVNSLNSSIKSGYKSTNSPSTNQAMLSGNWRQTSHFKQNKNLEQARLSYCNDLGPRLVCQHDTQGPVCCVRVWTVNHIWKGKVRSGCWKCGHGGNLPSFLLAELALEKSCPYTDSCLSFPVAPHSSALSLSIPFHGVYPAQSHFMVVLI